MEDLYSSTISTPTTEKSLEDFSHLFESPDRCPETELTASPPLFSNIVLKTVHDANIDLNVLFNILPIVKISPEEIKRSGKDYNEVFISSRKYPKARGYRCPSNIKSFLDLDFYFMDRNFHCKISTHKISIVGGDSMETSRALIKTLFHHFETLHDIWTSFREIPTEKKNEIFTRFKENNPPLEDPSGDPSDKEFYRILDSIIDRNEEDINERLCDISPIIGAPLYDKPPVFNELVNCNSVYNYRLPEEISLQEKSALLYSKGYEVMYHNVVVVKCMKATWKDPETGKSFGFSIQNLGNIKQNSKHTHEESLKMYEKLVTDLGFQPYCEGKKYAIKPKSRTCEVVKRNKGCLEILDRFLKIE